MCPILFIEQIMEPRHAEHIYILPIQSKERDEPANRNHVFLLEACPCKPQAPMTISAHIFTTFHESVISSFLELFWISIIIIKNA